MIIEDALSLHGFDDYSLTSVIFHSGNSLRSGHYFSLIKRFGGWIEYNDSQVVPHDEIPNFARM